MDNVSHIEGTPLVLIAAALVLATSIVMIPLFSALF